MDKVLVKRRKGIDILKCLCAFLVVCIHAPFPWIIGEYFIALARIAVPIFFMISGYFFEDQMKKQRGKKQVYKILKLLLGANMLYALWGILLAGFSQNSISAYLHNIFRIETAINFLIFNESPAGSHLWYLGALLYVLLISSAIYYFRAFKYAYIMIPILLITDLIFGKYSICIFDRMFPVIWVRNFLFVGLPYFWIGHLVHKKEPIIKDKVSIECLYVLTGIFALLTIVEHRILEINGVSAIRDHYISTTFLASTVFLIAVYFSEKKTENKRGNLAALIGKEYSAYIYNPLDICEFNGNNC